MRLLRTSTFELESFFDLNLPRYALLSHIWGDDEVTLQELQQEDSIVLLRSLRSQILNGWCPESWRPEDEHGIRQGFYKIVGSALCAEEYGFEYIWCDTCCIDKTNSSELSEAINSMYHWYKDQVCFAYLADVSHSPLSEREFAFAKSRWFTRGWTLQELIAPSNVVFFDEIWKPMGSRSVFRGLISERTGIDTAVLDGQDPKLSSVAKRMSWASQRETTRIEDMAYCLMGLFGVNMPMLYGERERAFLRLQEEIMKNSEDHTLFAWRTPSSELNHRRNGLLAPSPAYFLESRNIVSVDSVLRDDVVQLNTQTAYFMTNRGISISLPLLQLGNSTPGEVLAVLDCMETTDARGPLAIFLEQSNRGYYSRIRQNELIPIGTHQNFVEKSVEVTRMYVQQYQVAPRAANFVSAFHIHLPYLPKELSQEGLISWVCPNESFATWNPNTGVLRCLQGLGAAIYVGRTDGHGRIFLLGVDHKLQPQGAFDDQGIFQSAPSIMGRVVSRLRLIPSLGQLPTYQAVTATLAPRVDRTGSPGWSEIRMTWKNNSNWDQWISRPQKTSTQLALRVPVQNQGEKSPDSDSEDEADEILISVGASIETEVVNGQRMFVVRFHMQDT